ncbi:hypothetical protein P378_16775 [Desulforamulus profundi]|uniref:Uncharacterized protein n=1 Tax=Desulforamulus profundi TaxID=1383067 RepID=A0A2C6MBD2_9FIRM|nr:hypothetical protein P378_16775 [Desulforamulus profundi]
MTTMELEFYKKKFKENIEVLVKKDCCMTLALHKTFA